MSGGVPSRFSGIAGLTAILAMFAGAFWLGITWRSPKTERESGSDQMTPAEREISRKALVESFNACLPDADEPDKAGWIKAHEEACQKAMKAMQENSPLAFARKRDLQRDLQKRCDALRSKKIVDLTVNDFEILKQCGIPVPGFQGVR